MKKLLLLWSVIGAFPAFLYPGSDFDGQDAQNPIANQANTTIREQARDRSARMQPEAKANDKALGSEFDWSHDAVLIKGTEGSASRELEVVRPFVGEQI